MKICSNCKKLKDVKDFNKNAAKCDGLQTYCRECDNARKQNYYRANVNKYLEYNKKKLSKLKTAINAYKTERGCSQCGETDYRCLDFHHINDDKLESISVLRRKGSITQLWEEVVKCAIICANCHRKLHYG